MDNQEIYSCCKLVISLFRKLLTLFPTLKAQLGGELNQMLNKVITDNRFDKSFAHKILLEIIATSSSSVPLTDFFSKLPSDVLIHQLLRSGNIFHFELDKIRELFSQKIDDLVASKEMLHSKYYTNIIDLFQGFSDQSYKDWIEFLFKQFRNYSKVDDQLVILHLMLLSIVAIQQVNWNINVLIF
jgi:hypothetical protein